MTNPNDLVFSDKQGEYFKPLINNEQRKVVEPDLEYKSGLTKREYFAAMAMQGLSHLDMKYEDLAKTAVKTADATIAELNKEVKP